MRLACQIGVRLHYTVHSVYSACEFIRFRRDGIVSQSTIQQQHTFQFVARDKAARLRIYHQRAGIRRTPESGPKVHQADELSKRAINNRARSRSAQKGKRARVLCVGTNTRSLCQNPRSRLNRHPDITGRQGLGRMVSANLVRAYLANEAIHKGLPARPTRHLLDSASQGNPRAIPMSLSNVERDRYATLRMSRLVVESVAGRPESELGASR
jgi:hypothetical protein